MTSANILLHVSKRNSDFPGPGAYDTTDLINKKGKSITISQKPKVGIDQKPNPDFVMVQSTIGQGPRYSFGGRPKEIHSQPTPGPDYIPPTFGKNAVASSFRGRIEGTKSQFNQTPGPGEYIVPSPIGKTGKGFTMKARVFPRDTLDGDAPGPGQYKPNYQLTMPNVRSSSIGNFQRSKSSLIPETPGPGQYDVARPISGTKPTFHIRTNNFKPMDTPGPTDYFNPKPMGSEAPSHTIRPRIDNKPKYDDVPIGPAPQTFGTGPKSSFHGMQRETKLIPSPGPDYVPPPFGADSSKYSFRQRITQRTLNVSDLPGPGEYAIPSSIGKGKMYSIKSREKVNIVKDETPGPANYDPNYYVTIPTRKSVIGTRISNHKIESSPGYNYIPSQSRGPQFTIGKRDHSDVLPGR